MLESTVVITLSGCRCQVGKKSMKMSYGRAEYNTLISFLISAVAWILLIIILIG